MKLATLAAIAGLTTAMALGATAIPADAGNKSKKQAQKHRSNTHQTQHGHSGGQSKQQKSSKRHAHQGNSGGKVHVDPRISDKNLRKLMNSKRLSAGQKNALADELYNRKIMGRAGRALGSLGGADAILGIGLVGAAVGTKQKKGH
jgi:hypothetical protein